MKQDIQQRKKISVTLAVMAFIGVAYGALPIEQHAIPPWTLALEQQLQPWCPAKCDYVVPFTAIYKKGDVSLVFVGVRHVFTSKNDTSRAIDAGFAAASPAIVVLEGFPTVMGENPAPLVKEAREREFPEADDHARGEAMYTASLALQQSIPFVGGEPTREQQKAALERKGYATRDIAFASIVGGLSQSLRAGDLTGANDPKLREVFEYWARSFAREYKMQPMSFEDFSAQYRSTFHEDIARDTELTTRSDPGMTTAVALLSQADMITRDEHLLATIKKELESKERVLVVYGASHWTTLSAELERMLENRE